MANRVPFRFSHFYALGVSRQLDPALPDFRLARYSIRALRLKRAALNDLEFEPQTTSDQSGCRLHSADVDLLSLLSPRVSHAIFETG